MCGINGIFAVGDGIGINPAVLRRTRDFMRPRGPDGFGEWIDAENRIGLGHRRLSIIDLSPTGAQPMLSLDGKIAVTFNGEIYNYRALRRELEADGCVFQSQSDTEVLIHLYRRHGTAMMQLLRGMFAFGLWDAERRQLVLARDPYGIKPLYYAYGAGTLQFASSVKALLEGGDVSRQPDAAGIVGFQIFGSVPEPWTTYKAVKSLPAGSFMTIDASGTANTSLYFSLAETYRRAENHGTADPDATSWFRASLLESVRQHLVADVPVGAFLSAGVDSGALVGLMRDAGQSEIRTLTLAFEAFRGTERDESPLAQQVAQLYGTRHTTRWVGAAEFHDDLPKIMAAMDQPSIDGINTWFVSKAAAEIGLKVALSGAGGDELLGGYHTFVRLPALVRKLRLLPSLPGSDRLLGGVASLARKLGLLVHPKAAGLLEYGRSYAGAYLLQRSVYLPFEMQAMIQDDDFLKQGLEELQPLAMIERLLQPGLKRDFSKIAVLESGFYLRNQLLRDTDWAGMAHSLEIRTPLVDSVLLEKIAPLFTGRKRPDGKALLAAAPSTPLPPAVANRVKTGFGIPVKSWYADKPGDLPDGYSAQASERLWSRTWMKKISALSAEPDQAGCGQAA